MIRLITIIAAFLTVALGHIAHPVDWEEFKSLHNVNYANQLEETMRRSVFEQNKAYIEKFNAERAERDGYRLEVNKFADRTEEELIAFGSRKELDLSGRNSAATAEKLGKLIDDRTLPPDELDWTKVEGRVTPVKDEGQCHAHWAFAALGGLEGQMKVLNKTMVSLSAQNLVDCSKSNQNCSFGFILDAWTDIYREGGVEADEMYPYTAKTGDCRFERSKAVMSVKSASEMPFEDEFFMKRFIAVFGPLTAFINSTPKSFKFYKGGVYYDKECTDMVMDRGVLIVGYGIDKASGLEYWLIKNSWGTQWGENGYMRLARNMDNLCAITNSYVPQF